MILGIGTDISEVSRFSDWENFSTEKKLKIFSRHELESFKKSSASFPQFLASRFAAKEAFYKALSISLVTLGLTKQTFSFYFARQHIEVEFGEWEIPVLKINWEAFEQKVGVAFANNFRVKLSISHEKTYAIAFVIIEKSCRG
jgi:holo-[acyl-carrier protein] synthase